MLVTMKELMKDAKEKQYAVGCYNAINLDMIRGIIQAAEEENSPVMLCHAEVHFQLTPLNVIAPIMIEEAKRAKVPVGVHLDHGKSFSALMEALKLGFTSLMYDGSILPFEENLKNTAEIVKIAKQFGASVEAELGHVSRPEGGGSEDKGDATEESEDLHTKPDEATFFVERTGVDALAVAYGTAHGVYLIEPTLDFVRLAEIEKATNMPLVMHGGSGLSEEEYKTSIEKGITKINYYTNMALAVANKVKENINSSSERVYYHNIMMWSIDAVKEDIAKTMRLFGSTNKA